MSPTLPDPQAFVVEAELELADGLDPRAVGAAVTVELCGHWEHEGACRWPHHSAIDAGHSPARFRTVAVASADEADDVAARIRTVLEQGTDWRATSVATRAVAEAEQALAANLKNPRAGLS